MSPEPADQLAAPQAQDTSTTTTGGESLDARLCGREKADGTPCKAYKVKGQDACAGHLGMGIASDPSAYAAKAGESRREKGEARRRAPRDVYAQALVAHADELVARLLKIALKGEDDGAALRAIEQLTSRVLGKPKESVEQLTRPAELAAVAEMTREERDALWRELAAEDDGVPLQ